MAAAETNAQIAPPGVLRAALIVIAAIVILGAIAELPIAFHDFGHTDPWLVFAKRVTSARVMMAPLIAGTALVFAAIGRVRTALVILAALMLLRWVSELPTFPTYGIKPPFSTVVMTLVERLAFPMLAVAAIIFAARNRRLMTAALIVILPTILSVTVVILFGFGIMIHGL